jgi:carboxyl-terminal processing protease
VIDVRGSVVGIVLALLCAARPRTQTPSPVTPAQVVDAAISITKTNALRRNDVSWDIVEPAVRAMAAGAGTSADVYPAIRYLLEQLGDHHSYLLPPAQATEFQTGGAQNPIPEIRALQDGVGYISMPGYSGADRAAARAYATRMHEGLDSTRASVSCGWVVDLRQNTGGNMWPMLAGLKPFVGNADLGTFESPTGASQPWIAGQAVGVEPPPALAVLESSWVAVLTGPRTASSGEAVTIAFRGRPRTRSFGQPTAGLSTANSTFPLPDGATIILTTAIEADRTGKRYGDKIDPDERMDTAAGAGDTTLSAATGWLKQRACS